MGGSWKSWVRFPLYAMWRKRLIQQNMPALLERCFSKIVGKYLLFNGSPDPLFILVLVFVSIFLIVAVSKKNKFASTSPVGKWVLSTLGIVCNFLFSQQGHFVECMEESPTNNNNNNDDERGKGKEPLEHEGVPPQLRSMDDFIEVPLSPAEQGARSTPTTGPAGASSPSSSFFRGVSGQIPRAPDSPGGEVQQRELPPFNPCAYPEVPQEHVFAAAPERGTAGSGVEGPSSSYVEERIAQFLSSYGKGPRNRGDHVRRMMTELQLDSSDQEDRLKLLSLMSKLGPGDRGTQKSEAGGLLVEEYAKYYESKYGQSIYLKRNK